MSRSIATRMLILPPFLAVLSSPAYATITASFHKIWEGTLPERGWTAVQFEIRVHVSDDDDWSCAAFGGRVGDPPLTVDGGVFFQHPFYDDPLFGHPPDPGFFGIMPGAC